MQVARNSLTDRPTALLSMEVLSMATSLTTTSLFMTTPSIDCNHSSSRSSSSRFENDSSIIQILFRGHIIAPTQYPFFHIIHIVQGILLMSFRCLKGFGRIYIGLTLFVNKRGSYKVLVELYSYEWAENGG